MKTERKFKQIFFFSNGLAYFWRAKYEQQIYSVQPQPLRMHFG